MKVSYNWLQTFFTDGEMPSVTAIEDKLIFHAYEIEGVEVVGDDSVIDVDVLPNRASDSLSHRGIAREIATQFSLQLINDPLVAESTLEPISEKIALTVDSAKVCPVHTLALVEGVKVGASPDWLKKRLEAIGQKSINNVVDATNYVMFGLGQPSHVFDFDKLTQKGGTAGIRVRAAKEGETLTLLGGAEVTLTSNMNVLADIHSDTALDVAGVKGGAQAELDESTTNVLVTCAKFDPTITRKAAQGLKIRTDASARYENEVPDQMPKIAIQEVVALIQEIAGGTLDGYVATGDADHKNNEVQVSSAEITRYLGREIPESEVTAIFNRLGFTNTLNNGVFSVTAPLERLDIIIKEDLIEEVGRVYGYKNIEAQALPEAIAQPKILQKYALAQRLRKVLHSLGYREVFLYSLRSSGDIVLQNALNTEKDHLRNDLAASLVKSLESNERSMALLGEYDAVKIFEIGTVFTKDAEELNLCVGARGLGKKKKEARTAAELLRVKEVLEAELRVPLPEADEETLECSLTKILDENAGALELGSYERVGTVESGLQFSHISQYPFVTRDIAMWAPEGIEESVITDVIKKHGGELCKRVDKFDEFVKEGRVSLAFHLIFQSMEKTLTDDEVGEIMSKIEVELGGIEGFEVR